MDIVRLRANRLENPLGYDLSGLSLSWVVEKTKAKKQEYAEIVISKSESFESGSIVYKSGKKKDADSRSFMPGIVLEPRTRYYWKVEVYADNGESAESDTAFFEAGKLEEAWQAEWITADKDKDTHPYLRKSFTVEDDVKSARAYVSAAGIYELELNGKKVVAGIPAARIIRPMTAGCNIRRLMSQTASKKAKMLWEPSWEKDGFRGASA